MPPGLPAPQAEDPSARLAELRDRLAELRRDYQGHTSLREIAKRTGPDGITYTTVDAVLKCERLPQLESLRKVVAALGGDKAMFEALHTAAGQRRPEVPAKARPAHVRVNTEAWFPVLARTGVSEGLLRGLPAGDVEPDLAELDAFVRGSLPAIQLDVQTAFQSRVFRVDSAAMFWIVMLVDSILTGDRVGERRWLLSTTDEVKRRHPEEFERVREVWQWTFDTYLRSSADGLLEWFVDEAIGAAGDDHNRLYRGLSLLLDVAKKDPPSVQLIRAALQRRDDELRADGAGPKMLGKLRVLIVGADHDHYTEGELAFRDKLVPFPPTEVRPYEFRAMRYPLRVADVEAILGRPLDGGPALPFVLDQPPGDDAFRGLSQELTRIISSVPPFEDEGKWRWDIPTVAEWLTLADCVDQPYPWGWEPPTPKHANLKWTVESRLSPVETFLEGKTKAGVYDCCGGVHEIVRELPHERFETDQRFEAAFRIAGGSYWTPPAWVDCQGFRRLSRQVRGGPRSTVGIRLIVYREADEEPRWRSLKAFRVARQFRDH
ncbi:hypothetical protein [Asanoa iriomotensis]|uniref:XRE family transcriptional regulator n=1 Tax=Asanoa iriomotensis TaxID=234613 RepID=A0ABQ4C5L4_9ACTN|nr:hypothetical protein [Asanoa iriomotensis]GIF58073.1 hypothetical protein Air01nite_41680 [Asanoa iriomotensis]